MNKKLLCVPNFSEGRNLDTIRAIINAIEQSGVELLNYSYDVDHNRMVAAFIGGTDEIKQAILASTETAIKLIDLRTHVGQHPRLGAVDVAPIIPQSGISEDEAIKFSKTLAQEVAERFHIPVYLYEKSAQSNRLTDLPSLRKGGFNGWVQKELTGDHKPDYGPSELHSTAGAVILGVRDPLVAFNINLNTSDITLAKSIAKEIRENRDKNPILKGVRAIGVFLESRQLAQVSMNITHPDKVNLFDIYAYVSQMAKDMGVEILESELIGVIRDEDLIRVFNKTLRCNLSKKQVLRQ